MTKDNSAKILSIPGVVSVERLSLNKATITSAKGRASAARRAARDIFAYKIIYRSQGHNVVGFIVEPRTKGIHPCVIWNRGGSHDIGSITPQFIFGGDLSFYARAGYVVIASQYSGNCGSEGVDEYGGGDLEDVFKLRTILKHYKKADEKRIGMYGWSRGGMMTFMALQKVKWVKAAVLVAPVTDLVRTVAHRKDLKKHYKNTFGNKISDLKKRSVVFWIKDLPKKTPLLIMHGTGDKRIRPTGTLEASKRMYRANIPHRTIIFEGADHLLTEFRDEAKQEALTWFDRFVKNGEPLPDITPHGV